MCQVGVVCSLIPCDGEELISKLNEDIPTHGFIRAVPGGEPISNVPINEIFGEDQFWEVLMVPVYELVELEPDNKSGRRSFVRQIKVTTIHVNPIYSRHRNVQELEDAVNQVAASFEKVFP